MCKYKEKYAVRLFPFIYFDSCYHDKREYYLIHKGIDQGISQINFINNLYNNTNKHRSWMQITNGRKNSHKRGYSPSVSTATHSYPTPNNSIRCLMLHRHSSENWRMKPKSKPLIVFTQSPIVSTSHPEDLLTWNAHNSAKKTQISQNSPQDIRENHFLPSRGQGPRPQSSSVITHNASFMSRT